MASTIDTESFTPITERLEPVEQQTGRSRYRVFNEWLEFVVASLSRNEESYEDLVEDLEQYIQGEESSVRECLKAYSRAFGALVEQMEDTTVRGTDAPADILGGLYEHYGATSDHFGQYFTPGNAAIAKAEMALPNAESIRDATPEDPLVIGDPTCGSGRLPWYALHRLREISPETPALAVARDIDKTCAWMAAINFALWGMRAYVVHGNSLTYETWAVWRVDPPTVPRLSSDQEGIITSVPLSEAPIRTAENCPEGPDDLQEEESPQSEEPESDLTIEQRSQVSLPEFSNT